MKIQFLGASDGVSGSRHLVETADRRILPDCGLFQGWKLHRERNWLMPPELNGLDAVVLSHAHLDHSGWLPALVPRVPGPHPRQPCHLRAGGGAAAGQRTPAGRRRAPRQPLRQFPP